MNRSMNRPAPLRSFTGLPLAIAVSIAVTACGGGGGTAAPAALPVAETTLGVPAAVTAAAAEPAPLATPAPVTESVIALSDAADLPASAQAKAGDMTAAALAVAVAQSDVVDVNAASASDISSKTAQGVNFAVIRPSLLLATPTAVLATPGRVFYVDSRIGNDASNGVSASVVAGSGPWRTLGKVAAAGLLPGDTVLLACGGVWNETLRIGASGTAALPITIAAFPAGCSTQPRIDGNVTIPAAAWSLHGGRIYKAAVVTPPLQVHAVSGSMQQAHHPNRGHDASRPNSVYLKIAADGDRTATAGRIGSATLTTGADLLLPPGAVLQAGATVRVRTNGWLIDESTVTAVTGNKLTLASPTSYPLTAGWGYFLLGQLWMLDSPGEWHYDGTSRTLYAWHPNGNAPSADLSYTSLPTGVDLQSRSFVVLDGLHVTRVGTGISALRSGNVTVRNSRIEHTAGSGIEAGGSTNLRVLSNLLIRNGREAIDGIDPVASIAHGMEVTGNTITESAVVMAADAIVSLPVGSTGAVLAGAFARVTDNRINGSGYHGIRTAAASTVARNDIRNVCLVLDDCGAIYMFTPTTNGSLIDRNVIQGVRGNADGKPAGSNSQAEGIYLDDHAFGVVVSGNTVTGAESGILLHNAAGNQITDNVLYGNRKHQIWLYEDSKIARPTGDIYDNVIRNNQLFSTSPNAAVGLLSTIGEVARFASFDGNRYSGLLSSRIVSEAWPTGSNAFTFAQWQAAKTANGTARLSDVNGSVLAPVGFAAVRVLAASIQSNGNISDGNRGWTPWNDRAPLATAVATNCPQGACLEVSAGASPSLVATPPFSVGAGQWYRVSYDISANLVGQPISVLVRRGGGGSNGFESLMGSAEMVNTTTTMQRYSFTFRSLKTINAADPVTKDIGARLYFDRIQPGTRIQLMNVEVVPVSSADAAVRTQLLVNATDTPAQAACPDLATAPAICSLYLRFTTGLGVGWPFNLDARGSAIIYSRDLSLVDSDGDGIGDVQDQCLRTPAGRVTNARGCALGE